VHEGSIVFRTAQDTCTGEDLRTGIADAEYSVAFEIDQIDPETGQDMTSPGMWPFPRPLKKRPRRLPNGP
jgi:hypothetical protein